LIDFENNQWNILARNNNQIEILRKKGKASNQIEARGGKLT